MIIVYKQFFDGVPKEFREAAVMDGATELQHPVPHLPADELGHHHGARIITFIGAWNAFLWPFLAVTAPKR